MKRDTFPRRLIRGAEAGIAGTFAIQEAMALQKNLHAAATPPMRQEPADFLLDHVPVPIPKMIRPYAKKAAQLGYGVAFGVLYSAVRKRPRNVMLEGALLGLVTWATGYLGWLPAVHILPAPKRQSAAQLSGPIATHLVYGIATVAAYSKV